MSELFQRVYPFTTENISGYFHKLDLNDKSVLTVGSSGDQAFNALLLGAGRVVLYDINPNTFEYLKLKRDFIINSSREELYQKIINQKKLPLAEELYSFKDLEFMNDYLRDDESYKRLQGILQEKNIEFIHGDIFKMQDFLKDESFDRMIFSNILQYIDIFFEFSSEEEKKEFVKKNFLEWISHLNDNGILQLMYYYCLKINIENFMELASYLEGYRLNLSSIPDFQNSSSDGIVTYIK